MTQTIERIQTGMTAHYVPYWTVRQAIKEAAQNIAYGAVKAGQPAHLEYIHHDSGGYGIMEDSYTGFEKRHLYLGESEQRDDEQGLGNFGEGWKVFLLVSARNSLVHKVETVGFTFWGEMTPTPHGTDVLTIMVVPNSRTVGTRVEVECPEDDFNRAIESFATLADIPSEYIDKPCIIPNRQGELWVNGVRIEQGDNLNPLELRFAYHLKDRSLLNRDRSQVNTSLAYTHIRGIIGAQPVEFVKEYVKAAMQGATEQDIVRGPYFTSYNNKYDWLQAIAEAHFTQVEKLVIPSGSADLDKEAQYRGYCTIKLPSGWHSELNWLGIPKVEEVVKIRPNIEEVPHKELYAYEVENLKRAKLDTKKALGLSSITQLPEIKIVKDLSMGAADANGMYEPDTKTVYLCHDILGDKAKVVRVLIHECLHWQTGAGDNQPQFTRGFERAILRLLGHLG